MFLYTFTVIYKSYIDFPANNWLKIVVKKFAFFQQRNSTCFATN